MVGFDFNPSVDRLRIVGATGENYRVNPDSGGQVDGNTMLDGVQPDAPLAYAAGDRNAGVTPAVTAAAYTNSVRGQVTAPLPATTTLFDIDTQADALVTQDPPNDGTLNTRGQLGVNFQGNVGFDISPDNNRSLVVADDGGGFDSYRVDRRTGRAIRQSSPASTRPSSASPSPPPPSRRPTACCSRSGGSTTTT